MEPEIDLEEITDGRALAIWYCPAAEGRKPVLLVEQYGPKPYRRLWLDGALVGKDDWTHFKPSDAIRLA